MHYLSAIAFWMLYHVEQHGTVTLNELWDFIPATAHLLPNGNFARDKRQGGVALLNLYEEKLYKFAGINITSNGANQRIQLTEKGEKVLANHLYQAPVLNDFQATMLETIQKFGKVMSQRFIASETCNSEDKHFTAFSMKVEKHLEQLAVSPNRCVDVIPITPTWSEVVITPRGIAALEDHQQTIQSQQSQGVQQ